MTSPTPIDLNRLTLDTKTLINVPQWNRKNILHSSNPSYTQCTFYSDILILHDKSMTRVSQCGSINTITFTNSPPRRRFGSMSQANSLVYLFGGLDENNRPLRDLWCIRIHDDPQHAHQWTKVRSQGDLPPPKFGALLSSFQHYLILFGGAGQDSSSHDSLFILNTQSNLWLRSLVPPNIKAISKWPSARALASHFTVNGFLYLFGGCSCLPPNADPASEITSARLWGRTNNELWRLRLSSICCNDSMEPPTGRWEKISISGAVPSPRAGACVSPLPFEGKVLIMGGFATFPRSSCADSFLLDCYSHMSSPLRCRGIERPPHRSLTTVATSSLGFVLCGGLSTSGPCSDVYSLDFIDSSSTPCTPVSATPTSSVKEIYSPRSLCSEPNSARSSFNGLPSLKEVVPNVKSPFSRPCTSEVSSPTSPRLTKAQQPLSTNTQQSISLLKSLSSVAETCFDSPTPRIQQAISYLKSSISIIVEELEKQNSGN
ncbi:hypothetical protein P9112_002602 [Eukaryota sp. TZLM1-RC]